jgi:hypothetical protein
MSKSMTDEDIQLLRKTVSEGITLIDDTKDFVKSLLITIDAQNREITKLRTFVLNVSEEVESVFYSLGDDPYDREVKSLFKPIVGHISDVMKKTELTILVSSSTSLTDE